MKYDKLTIIGLPKKFKVYYALDYIFPDGQLPDNPDDILYDEIGSVLKIKQYQNTKRELLESVETYYRIMFLGEGFDEEE